MEYQPAIERRNVVRADESLRTASFVEPDPDRIGQYLLTYTGICFYPLDPRPEEVDMVDVAHALSNQCRYNGHTRGYYSVAEHCCHLHDLFKDSERRKEALLHDAAEAYLSDMPRPLKNGPGYEHFRAAETALLGVILIVNGMAPSIQHKEVMMLDGAICRVEMEGLMTWVDPRVPAWPAELKEPLIQCWSPRRARDEFLRRLEPLSQ